MSEENTVIIKNWDSTQPSGVSTEEHYTSLCMQMIRLFFLTKMKGVFIMSPMVAAMLSVAAPTRFGNLEWGTGMLTQNRSVPSTRWKAGKLGRVEIWVDTRIVTSEILLTPAPIDLCRS